MIRMQIRKKKIMILKSNGTLFAIGALPGKCGGNQRRKLWINAGSFEGVWWNQGSDRCRKFFRRLVLRRSC